MADTPTTSGKYRKQGLGDRSAAWGLSSGLNGVFDSLDEAVHGVNVVSLATTNYTLTSTNYTSNESRQRFHRFANGGISSQPTITVPAVDNWWVISNAVTGQSLLISNGANTVNVADGQTAVVGTDGTNMYAFPFATSFVGADPGANGVVVRTSAGVTTARTLQAVSNELAMTNGSGISGNPTIGLASAINFAGKTLTGGNIDNTRIGANTRNDAFFTDVTVTNDVAAQGFKEATSATIIVMDATTMIANVASNEFWRCANLSGMIMSQPLDLNGNDLIIDADADTYIDNPADDVIDIYTAGAHAVRVDASGRVGIGTGATAPAALLDVNGGAVLGGSSSDSLTINAGTYTAPNIPLVHAYLSAQAANVTGDSTFYTVVFDTEVFDQGSDYNNTTGVFTAPTTGKYLIVTQLRISGMSSNNTRLSGQIVASNKTYSFGEADPFAAASADNRYGFGASIILDMDAADTVYIRFTVEATDKVVDLDGGDPTWISIQQVA